MHSTRLCALDRTKGIRRARNLLGILAVSLCARVAADYASPPSSAASPPQIVEIHSGDLTLGGYFWRPAGPGVFPVVLFNHGSGGDDAEHTAGRTMADAASDLAPAFLRHGYAFLYLCRRGQGLSANAAPFMGELLRKAENAGGQQARQHLQYLLATRDHLDDVRAGVEFLKRANGVDPSRIAVVGHSFGGMLTLLYGEGQSQVRPEVTFAAGAASWRQSSELRESVLTAVGKTLAPIMLVYAANDYDTTPGTELSEELTRLHKRHVLKIYSPNGQSSDEGHNFVYLGIHQWEPDVFRFLDANLKRR